MCVQASGEYGEQQKLRHSGSPYNKIVFFCVFLCSERHVFVSTSFLPVTTLG